MKKIVYYISSHGYGHSARAIAVIEKIIKDIQVTVKTKVPQEFFYEKIKSPYFTVISGEFDAGCYQKNFIEIDIEKTLHATEKIYYENYKKYNQEKAWLEKKNISLVLSDAPSFPLKLAADTGIPSMLITNFTWYDIYSRFSSANYKDIVNNIRNEYSQTNLQILPGTYIPNNYIENKIETGFIGVPGKNVRYDLQKITNKDFTGKTVVFMYFGIFDKSLVNWKNIDYLEDYIFLTKDNIENSEIIKNLFVIKNNMFSHNDLIASSDLVCTKLGYSTIATAFMHKKPIVFCDRQNFYEFDIMKKYLFEKKAGLMVPNDRFFNCLWEKELETAKTYKIENINTNGARETAEIIIKYLSE